MLTSAEVRNTTEVPPIFIAEARLRSVIMTRHTCIISDLRMTTVRVRLLRRSPNTSMTGKTGVIYTLLSINSTE